ncbi:alpha/beta hydrolase [Nonomuraea mesophila]|uniref:Alpha/beta hydrolase n=1 Tax=Nonomuraea mesophila TaxID=2530382 RepID=A0A4R5FU45_9ACTN|nr:alpha/beta hydrolase [Nonomuraea mesophila]TDE57437.1 alpha/beta hydrolase [Nonomuraea mesophila]
MRSSGPAGACEHRTGARHQLPALAAAGYRVVAPTSAGGRGETDVPPRVTDYTIDHLVGDREGDYGSTAMLDLLSGRSRSVPGLRDTLVLGGCGHWIQQERPEEVDEALIEFLDSL